MSYTLYIIETDKVDPSKAAAGATPVLATPCGLNYFSLVQGGAIRVTKITDSNTLRSSVSYDVSGLKPGTNYEFRLIATCDSACLSHLSKTDAVNAYVSCAAADCTSVTVVYTSTSTVTAKEQTDPESSRIELTVGLSFIAGIVLVVGLLVFVRYRMQRRQSTQQYHLTTSEEGEIVTVSQPRDNLMLFKSKTAYQPLLVCKECKMGVYLLTFCLCRLSNKTT
jgi:hypothetical protein